MENARVWMESKYHILFHYRWSFPGGLCSPPLCLTICSNPSSMRPVKARNCRPLPSVLIPVSQGSQPSFCLILFGLFFFPLFSGITSSASLKVGVDQKSNPISLFTPHTPAENLRSTQSSQYHKGPATTDAPAQSRSYGTRPVLPPPIWTPLPWQSTRTSNSTCVTCKTEPLSPPFKGPILEGWHHNCIPPSNESVSQGDSISQTS